MESRGLPLSQANKEHLGYIEQILEKYVLIEEEDEKTFVAERIARLGQYYAPESERMFELLTAASNKNQLGRYMDRLDDLHNTSLMYNAPEQSHLRGFIVDQMFKEWETQLSQ